MKIAMRKVGHKTLYRVVGSELWTHSKRQAIEHWEAYKDVYTASV